MSGPTPYTIRYYNSYSRMLGYLYPMITSEDNPEYRIWNGRDVSGDMWREGDGDNRVVDLNEDCDGTTIPYTTYYFAADVVGGGSPYLSDSVFTFDPNSTNVANVEWSGNAIDCGGSFNGITTYPLVNDPTSASGQREIKAGESSHAKSEHEAGKAGKERFDAGHRAPGVAV
ncbi:uncharacterized protein DNG_02226 [Cephalotrichum gorgonifer]|uniref:Uncharacterized protein n=1 Tax=Cephalotrichum gorgonifer TaxID=2041049 RepID=A0AAE8MUH1_9PEZI|nr:uncharacterized protein DNG_02226 [Cephalotrichum gorgonifer]